MHRSDQAGASPQEQLLPAAFHPRQPKDLLPRDVKRHRPHTYSPVLHDDLVELQHTLAGGGLQPRTQSDDPTEHHFDQPVRAVGRHGLAHQPAAAQHGNTMTQALDLFQLVGDEDDRSPLFTQLT